MAKNDNLTDFMTDLADAIREKSGTTEPINPQNFSTMIREMGGGSAGSTSEDDVVFFDVQDYYGEAYFLYESLPSTNVFIDKMTFYVELGGGSRVTIGAYFQGAYGYYTPKYVAFNNSYTPQFLLGGSGGLQLPEQEEPITFFEFIELVDEAIGSNFKEELTSRQVSREVVEEWLNAQS